MVDSKLIFLANYLVRCKESDLPICGAEAGNAVWPVISKGDSSFGIPNFYPLILNPVSFDEPDLELNLNNVELYGFETLHVNKVL